MVRKRTICPTPVFSSSRCWSRRADLRRRQDASWSDSSPLQLRSKTLCFRRLVEHLQSIIHFKRPFVDALCCSRFDPPRKAFNSLYNSPPPRPPQPLSPCLRSVPMRPILIPNIRSLHPLRESLGPKQRLGLAVLKYRWPGWKLPGLVNELDLERGRDICEEFHERRVDLVRGQGRQCLYWHADELGVGI